MTEVACAIIVQKGQVLVTQRGEQMTHPLKWEFPGGKVKVGESPEYCVKREIMEELGLRITVDQLLHTVKHGYDTHSIKLFPFICSVREGEVHLTEHKTFRWMTVGELDSVDWLDADVMVVEMLKEKYSEGSDPTNLISDQSREPLP